MIDPHREWLETNGLGGYASSTAWGINTRRYHGLLVAAVRPPAGRAVLLSKLEETLVVDGRRAELSANRYPGAMHPQGHLLIAGFHEDPFPRWIYHAEGMEIEKRVFMVHGENMTVVEYTARALAGDPVDVRLELRPLIAFRDYHGTTHANIALDRRVEIAPGCAIVRPYGDLPALRFAHSGGEVSLSGHWYHRFQYDRESERGLDFEEDLFQPFVLRFDLRAGGAAAVIASLEPRDAASAPHLREAELARRARIAAKGALAAEADKFIASRGEWKTVIAGYHWFADWGRDTMISLPGLTLSTGRFEVARDILRAFAAHVSQGMLPNRFPENGERPEYNTADATLWFFEAVRAYLEAAEDDAFAREIYPVLTEILDWHLRGTRYGIRVDEADGLLRCGSAETQLTWMDAATAAGPVTPRAGKPVEIQALWYGALCTYAGLSARAGLPGAEREMRERAAAARAGFARFWNGAEGCLYDVLGDDGPDAAIRPNQIFAVSLHHAILDGPRAASVVAVVERELLTPAGLRTLSPRDSRYRPRYEGGPGERDSAYHQGTVWPWLLAPFAEAYVRVNGGSSTARRTAASWLEGLVARYGARLPEIADAEPPHTARGCIAQAWSVAGTLRALAGPGRV